MRRLLLTVALLVSITLPAYARSSDDRASFGNDITIAEGETASDVACMFCDVHVHGDIRGDVAVMFGKVDVDPGRSISGDVATRKLWLMLPFAPLLILIGLIWLIVYLVRRNRYRFPAYPQGRGF